MFEYIKMVLHKVSFDSFLFEKELKKGLDLLTHSEIIQLRSWCDEEFANMHRLVIDRCFNRYLTLTFV